MNRALDEYVFKMVTQLIDLRAELGRLIDTAKEPLIVSIIPLGYGFAQYALPTVLDFFGIDYCVPALKDDGVAPVDKTPVEWEVFRSGRDSRIFFVNRRWQGKEDQGFLVVAVPDEVRALKAVVEQWRKDTEAERPK